MFTVYDDNSIDVTRGDTVFFGVTAEDKGKPYLFQPGDVVRIKVFEKKNCENVVLQKDFPVAMETDTVDIYLTEEETKIGEVISKPRDYWYEIELNPYTNPQTIIGYNDEGPVIFKLFPEGKDIPRVDVDPEVVALIDNELNMTSTRPVENQAIARAVVSLKAELRDNIHANANAFKEAEKEIAVERARIDNLISQKVASLSQNLEYLEFITEETKQKYTGIIESDGVHATVKVTFHEANLIYGGTEVEMFLIPDVCRPIDTGIIHVEDNLEYRIGYRDNRYYMAIRASNGVDVAPSGSGTVSMSYALGDYELKDICVDAGGFTHDSAGAAVRHQNKFDCIPLCFTEHEGWYVSKRSAWANKPETNFCMSNAVAVSELDDSMHIHVCGLNEYVANVVFTRADSHDDGDIIEIHIFTETGWHEVAIPSGAKYVYLAKCVSNENEIIGLPQLAYSRSEFRTNVGNRLKELGEVAKKAEDETRFELPRQYELVVGDTFELFWKGVIHSTNPEHYYVRVMCDKGIPYKRKFSYTPAAEDVGNHILTAELYTSGHALVDSATVELIVKNKAVNPAQEKVVLYVGDSLANSGFVPDEFHNRLMKDGLKNIAFIGDKTSVTNGVPYVGAGGWTFNSYNSSMQSTAFMWVTCADHGKTENEDQHSVYADANGTRWKLETIEANRIKVIRVSGYASMPASGELVWVSGGVHKETIKYTASAQAAGNPFWNETTGKVDFGAFASAHGKAKIDYVYVLLGWNSASDTEDGCKNAVRRFIDSVHSSFPDCKVILLGLQIPARDGLAMNYGAKTVPYSWYDTMQDYVFKLNIWYQAVADEYDNVSFINVAGQFDTDYNMQSSSVPVNVRNNTKETVQTNGVHPAVSGYYQIADMCYRDFVHKLS